MLITFDSSAKPFIFRAFGVKPTKKNLSNIVGFKKGPNGPQPIHNDIFSLIELADEIKDQLSKGRHESIL